MSVSLACLDTGLSKEELVQQEAILNCCDKTWSSFLCILALSSVIRRRIFTYYPDCGESRFRNLLNREIAPRMHGSGQGDIHILFCYEGVVIPGQPFKPNHFVPLIFHPRKGGGKRKGDSVTIGQAPKKAKSDQSLSLTKPATKISSFFNKIEKQGSSGISLVNSSSTSRGSISLSNSNINPVQKEEVPSVTPMTTMHGFDIACYREKVKGLDNAGVYNLVKNVFKPDKNYCFPKTKGRSFRYEWLELYPWLHYSPSKDGAFCLACVLFGDRFPIKASKIRKLFSEPLCRWNDAAFTFKSHTGHGTGGEMGLHSSTYPFFKSFISQVSGIAKPIEVLVNESIRKEIAENRKKLAPIIDTAIFCGRLGLPLRGHRDDAKYHPEVGHYSKGSVGNFVEALNFRVRAGDNVLEDHLRSCGKNQSYISKTSQNKIINCCGQVISDKIIDDLKKVKFYCILADEARDCSNKEQMSLVLRFVDSEMNIREEFIRFLHCKWGLSGAQLAKLITDALNELNIPIEDCRGQGYDGAGAVAGHINGLSAHILRRNSKALYTHCYSHKLNLSICDSLSLTIVNSMLKNVKEIAGFFSISQTRQIPLQRNTRLHSDETGTRKTKLAKEAQNACARLGMVL